MFLGRASPRWIVRTEAPNGCFMIRINLITQAGGLEKCWRGADSWQVQCYWCHGSTRSQPPHWTHVHHFQQDRPAVSEGDGVWTRFSATSLTHRAICHHPVAIPWPEPLRAIALSTAWLTGSYCRGKHSAVGQLRLRRGYGDRRNGTHNQLKSGAVCSVHSLVPAYWWRTVSGEVPGPWTWRVLAAPSQVRTTTAQR